MSRRCGNVLNVSPGSAETAALHDVTTQEVRLTMIRRSRGVLAAGALMAMLATASPAAAAGGETAYGAYGACVAHHAVNEPGFSSDHNPGRMHRGFAGWTGSCAHA